MSFGVAAHAIDRAGGASADRIRVATWMFGGDGDGTIGATNDRTFVGKRIRLAEVNDEASVFGTGGESDGGADFNAEGFVGLGVGDTRSSGCVSASATPDIDGARRGSGTTSVGLRANACEIGCRANVILDILFGLLANVWTSQEKRQDEQTGDCNKITISFHQAPHTVEMGKRTMYTGK